MKNLFCLISLMMVFALVGNASAVVTPTNVVGTTFEADSAGPGSWAASSNIDGQLDPVSGAAWADTSSTFGNEIVVTSPTPPEGTQAGQVLGTGGGTNHTSSGVALIFGNGLAYYKRGIFTTTFSMRYDDIGGDDSHNDATTLILRDTTFKDVCRIRLVRYYADDQFKIDMQTDTYYTLLDTAASDTVSPGVWYDFEIVADMETQLVSARVKANGASSWAAEKLDAPFKNPGYSFDQVKFYSDNANLSLIDDLAISRIPEPATVLLLGLGGLFLRRRK